MRQRWPLVGTNERQEMYDVELYRDVRLAVVEEGLSERQHQYHG